MSGFIISGNIVDVINKKIYPGTVHVENGRIAAITPTVKALNDQYILPGFIDAHVHIESSMLVPSEFARLATPHGTVATVSDPHEIGNVLGIEGVRYMIENGKQVPFHFYFGAPSCVPATAFETSGATISVEEIHKLFTEDHLKYLSEMMNFPAVLNRDPLVMDKIKIAQELGLPIDGHSPGLHGADAERYISAGISTDHECYLLEEAQDKIRYGMHILIREGSAAKNYEPLHPLIKSTPEKVMFCSDDKHPHDLVKGHIDQLVKRSIQKHGYDTIDVLRIACYNPVIHYKLEVGLLQPGDSADFIVVDNLRDFNVKKTYIQGKLVAENGVTLIPSVESKVVNKFHTQPKAPSDFAIQAAGKTIQVIGALDGELITTKIHAPAKEVDGYLISNTNEDILKIAVVNRYSDIPVATGFIKGFGLKSGALASCIAHDSHNIVAVGVTDEELCQAINAIIENRGGISLIYKGKTEVLPLPIAGIMSHQDGYLVAQSYTKIEEMAKQLGSQLHDPFMTLSFMALLVIPSLKMSDKGLFDAEHFCFTSCNA